MLSSTGLIILMKASTSGEGPELDRHIIAPLLLSQGSRRSRTNRHSGLPARVRDNEGRQPNPTLPIIDSQSVKTGKVASAATKSYDGGKRIKGRKRHVLVDSLGLLVDVDVKPANTHDTKGSKRVLEKYKKRVKQPRVKKIIGDKGYRGEILKSFVRTVFKVKIEIGKIILDLGQVLCPPARSVGWTQTARIRLIVKGSFEYQKRT